MALAQVIVGGILLGGIYALVSVGLTLIFGVLDVINFAHGSYLMLAMYVAFFAWSIAGLDPLAAIPIAAILLGLAGYVTYWIVIRPLMGKTGFTQIIGTFGLLVLIEGAAEVLWTPNPRAVSDPLADAFRASPGGIDMSGSQIIGFAGAVLATLAVAAFINYTEVGSAIRATGEDRAAAALMGINVRQMDALTWALGIGCVGVAGALLMNFYTVTPTAGLTFGLIAFFAVAFGGFGSVLGASIAGIILGVAQNVAGLYVPEYSLVALMGIYLLVVVVRPQGLLGSR